VTVTLNATNGVNLYSIAYNLAGFVPANPSTNYMADPGTSSTAQTYSFTAPAGFAFTVVVHEVNPGGGIGSAYTLSLSLAECAAGPACTPVTVTTPSVAPGSFGIAYSQSFAATGGSGAYTFSQTGTLPTGLSFSGNTISGTPTQTGTFPITITPNDAAGCSSTPKGFLLVVGGTATGFFNTVSPCRSLDTRAGAPIAGGGTIVAMLSGGACGIPADATAVSVNVTATQPAAPGFVNLYPGNQPPPPTSTMNFSGGQTRANNAIVSLATDGSGTIKITNGAAGTVHVIVDVNGYFK
jgi:hypothetical protein